MTNGELHDGFAEIIFEVRGIPSNRVLTESTLAEDMGIDSLAMVELSLVIEERFGVSISDDDLASMTTVGDAVEFLAQVTAAS